MGKVKISDCQVVVRYSIYKNEELVTGESLGFKRIIDGIGMFSYLKDEYKKEELEEGNYCFDLFVKENLEDTITLSAANAKEVISKYFETIPLSNE
ncbi:hypothetical protein [Bacillus sp. BB56-3]|uniref:hypothetical protein n=1 Tax=Bacillus sp. BB56-3 TaxID=2217831 RepID=UPI0011F04F41|nr:hypothetical protein [Bacillus sp. BB56-3]KAA0803770.1 hypothetical protein DN406_00380 [Bacillus sp. BB56-3]